MISANNKAARTILAKSLVARAKDLITANAELSALEMTIAGTSADGFDPVDALVTLGAALNMVDGVLVGMADNLGSVALVDGTGAATDSVEAEVRLRLQAIVAEFHAIAVARGFAIDALDKITLPGAMQCWIGNDSDGKSRFKVRFATSLSDALTMGNPVLDTFSTSVVELAP